MLMNGEQSSGQGSIPKVLDVSAEAAPLVGSNLLARPGFIPRYFVRCLF